MGQAFVQFSSKRMYDDANHDSTIVMANFQLFAQQMTVNKSYQRPTKNIFRHASEWLIFNNLNNKTDESKNMDYNIFVF